MLKSDQNKPTIEKQVLTAARKCFKSYPIEDNKIFTIFEHGHWWIRFFDENEERDRTFSVIDAEGNGTYNGFDFEEV